MRIGVLIILAGTAIYGQKPKDNPSDWPMYTRDLAGTRYSPLKQINAGNVSKLTEAWKFDLRAPTTPARPGDDPDPFAGAAGGGGAGGGGGRGGNGANAEATPIVVNGLMYLPAGRRVIALDPE